MGRAHVHVAFLSATACVRACVGVIGYVMSYDREDSKSSARSDTRQIDVSEGTGLELSSNDLAYFHN